MVDDGEEEDATAARNLEEDALLSALPSSSWGTISKKNERSSNRLVLNTSGKTSRSSRNRHKWRRNPTLQTATINQETTLNATTGWCRRRNLLFRAFTASGGPSSIISKSISSVSIAATTPFAAFFLVPAPAAPLVDLACACKMAAARSEIVCTFALMTANSSPRASGGTISATPALFRLVGSPTQYGALPCPGLTRVHTGTTSEPTLATLAFDMLLMMVGNSPGVCLEPMLKGKTFFAKDGGG
mmetsp:Transcript_47526/g.101676  ORF Transcript_47526/g.101676 Transcript_47526/m.101676 type:complete len:244 (-) Transcript_47526:2129-2860(-)